LYRNLWGGTLVYEIAGDFKDNEPVSEPQKLVA
jgi:hypothetical protein